MKKKKKEIKKQTLVIPSPQQRNRWTWSAKWRTSFREIPFSPELSFLSVVLPFFLSILNKKKKTTPNKPPLSYFQSPFFPFSHFPFLFFKSPTKLYFFFSPSFTNQKRKKDKIPQRTTTIRLSGALKNSSPNSTQKLCANHRQKKMKKINKK